MEMGMIGLGRMGGNMALRLIKRRHRVVAFDLSQAAVQAHAAQGAVGAGSWKDFVAQLQDRPRVRWILVPAGDRTTRRFNRLTGLGDPGAIIIDGGNTNWRARRDAWAGS